MKIRRNRLEALLTPRRCLCSRTTRNSLTFVRPDLCSGLYQKLILDFQGRHNEAVYGRIAVSVTKWIEWNTSESRTLIERATDPQRQWAIVESSTAARLWKQRYAERAPSTAETAARNLGPPLLPKTSHAREQAMIHLQHLDLSLLAFAQIQRFEKEQGELVRKSAARLAEWPGVVRRDEVDLGRDLSSE